MLQEISRARRYAIELHGEQKYDGQPYSYHLDKVYDVAVRFGFKDNLPLLKAVYFHDVLEDTDTSYEHVVLLIGEEAAHLAWCVKDEGEKGMTRKEKKQKTYPKIRESSEAVALKLIDRIANVEYSLTSNGKSLINMYAKEYPAMVEALKREGEHEELWSYLDSLISPYLRVSHDKNKKR